MNNKLYIKFENLNDIEKTTNVLLDSFDYLIKYYAEHNKEFLFILINKISCYFMAVFYGLMGEYYKK